MQLLRGSPSCHLNSALPLCLASIFQHLYLSIFVWWHLLCGFHSSGRWLAPPFLTRTAARNVDCAVCCVIMVRETGSPVVGYCHFVSTAILVCYSQWRAPHGHRTHRKDVQLFCFDNHCHWNFSLSVCVCEPMSVIVWGFQRSSQSRTRFHSRPRQSKTC